MECNANDVLFKCVLFADTETSCYTIQMLNQVMFWFTEMMCYNVYIPLLIAQANDVEENPGPKIFDIVDPMIIVSLTIGNNLYVSKSKDIYGMPHSFGKCTLLSIKGYHICKCLV